MSKYEKQELDEAELGINPFVSSLKIPVNSVRSDNKYRVHDKSSGEDSIYELANFDYEATPYCKVFSDKQRRTIMAKLKPRSKDLFLWIGYELKSGKDYIWINKVRYMEENEVGSINTYKSAIVELMQTGIIAKIHVMDYYWINPHWFFNGNRITKFPDNVVRK
jgi:hypothetical protein